MPEIETTERDLVTEAQAKATPKRVAGNFDFYEQRDCRWFCRTCGGEVKAVERYAPVWDGPFPCSGSGEVEYWQEPYCPNCEVEPRA